VKRCLEAETTKRKGTSKQLRDVSLTRAQGFVSEQAKTRSFALRPGITTDDDRTEHKHEEAAGG